VAVCRTWLGWAVGLPTRAAACGWLVLASDIQQPVLHGCAVAVSRGMLCRWGSPASTAGSSKLGSLHSSELPADLRCNRSPLECTQSSFVCCNNAACWRERNAEGAGSCSRSQQRSYRRCRDESGQLLKPHTHDYNEVELR
jgi:hypothetical protein